MRLNFRAVAGSTMILACSCCLTAGAASARATSHSALAAVPQRFFALMMNQDQPTTPPSAPPADQKKGSSQPETPLPNGPGRELTKTLCGKCHSNNVWTGQRHSSDKWGSIIENMVSKGMVASDDDLTTVNDYLAAKFAPPSKDAEPPATGSSAGH